MEKTKISFLEHIKSAPFTFLGLLFIVMVIIFSLQRCNDRKLLAEKDQVILGLDSSYKLMLVDSTKKGEKIYELGTILAGEKALRSLAEEKFDKVKKANTYLSLQLAAASGKIEIRYDTIANFVEMDSCACLDTSYLRVPKPILFEDEWRYLSGTIHKRSAIIDSFGFKDLQLDIYVGAKKGRANITSIKTTNPYFKVNDARSITVYVAPAPWYHTRAAWGTYGIILGVLAKTGIDAISK